MKNKLILILGGLFLAAQAATGFAATTFTVSASVPQATGVGFTVSSVNATTNAFTTLAAGTTALNFGTLALTNVGTTAAPSYIYLPTMYYAIDIAATGGSGNVTSAVQYTEGTNPNGSTNGMGTKTTATFVKETYTSATTPPTEAGITSVGPKVMLSSLTTALTVPATATTGGWLRVYLGIWNGDSKATYPDPATGKPFTTGDVWGAYSGTLTFTETIS
jgi:hypothetical protein